MKKLMLLIAALFVSNGIFAQSPLEEGGIQLNAGLGLSGWGIPIYFGLDYGIAKDFTLGGQLSYQSDSDSYYGNSYKASAIGLGANGNYHFNSLLSIPSKFDFYAGANITYYIWDYDDGLGDNGHPDNDDLNFGLQVGGRYFFTDQFGINLELGGGTASSDAKIGVTFKL